MNETTLNLHIGKIHLRKRGKKGIYQLDIRFRDIENDNRYRDSTCTNKLKDAMVIAQEKAESEFKRRRAGIIIRKNITPQNYIKNIHIPWLTTQIGKPFDNKPNGIYTPRKYKNDTQILRKWFYPWLLHKSWEHLETSKFGRDLTSHLRNDVADSTISSYLGVFNRMLRQAEIESLTTSSALKGVPALAQAGTMMGKSNPNAYAVFTDDMMKQIFDYQREKIEKTTHQGFKRTYIQTYAFTRILADTGIRPFTVCPLTFEMFEDQGDMIILDRQEKNKRYNAQGSQITRDALDDLRKLYLSEGTNVKQHKHLPLIHHAPCGNSYNGKPVEPRTQIVQFYANITRTIRALGFFDMVDREDRKYRNYSIRKWHINKSIDEDESGESIAKRVGHTYAVLERFYLDKYAKQHKKADIWGMKENKRNTL